MLDDIYIPESDRTPSTPSQKRDNSAYHEIVSYKPDNTRAVDHASATIAEALRNGKGYRDGNGNFIYTG